MKKHAVVFPGQGSQSLGMLNAWADTSLVRDTFHEASSSLGYDLWELAQRGPEERLNQTEFTQPVVLTADIALWRLFQSHQTFKPDFLAGHSLGEYSALVAAESLTLIDAVTLVAKRGRYMQEAVPSGTGAMAAVVGLDNITLTEICQKSRQGQEVLSPANFNSIGQTVIAGNCAAVDRAVELALTLGAKMAKRIPISVPSHCELMRSAVEKLEKDLAKTPISPPKISVIHNFDVSIHHSADEIRQVLLNQLTAPVRWVETIQFLEKNGIQNILECGPGKVLCGLNKRISSTISNHSFDSLPQG
jgi:[acyl-carrier-protein] S-malonyltransferase